MIFYSNYLSSSKDTSQKSDAPITLKAATANLLKIYQRSVMLNDFPLISMYKYIGQILHISRFSFKRRQVVFFQPLFSFFASLVNLFGVV